MDQTIRMILELDAAAEARLQASEAACAQTIENAKEKASALAEARERQTSDAIYELEEIERTAAEQEIRALQADYEKKSAALEKQFTDDREAMISSLVSEILAEAEA